VSATSKTTAARGAETTKCIRETEAVAFVVGQAKIFAGIAFELPVTWRWSLRQVW
jgi:hypothetical protein